VKKRPLILSAVLVVALVTGVLLVNRPRPEPVYEGKTVREWAMLADAGDQPAQAMIKSLGREAVPDLVRMLRTHDSWWRIQLWEHSFGLPRRSRARILQQMNPPGAVRIRSAAAHELATLTSNAAPAIPALSRALTDDEMPEAATALAQIGPSALPALIRALQAQSPKARQAAADVLGKMGPDALQAMPPLKPLLLDPDKQVRFSAAYSLVALGTPGLPANRGFALPQDPRARSAALRLRLTHDSSIQPYLEPLVDMAQAPTAGTRIQALEILGALRLASPDAMTMITNALTDKDPQVRLAACKVIAQLSPRSSPGVPALTAWLKDPSPDIRQWSAQRLGELGPAAVQAIPDLQNLQSDKDSNVRIAGRGALMRIGEPGQAISGQTP